MKMRTEIAAGVAAAIMISLVGCGSSDVPAGPPEIEATDIAIVSGYHQNAVTPPINNSEILKAFAVVNVKPDYHEILKYMDRVRSTRGGDSTDFVKFRPRRWVSNPFASSILLTVDSGLRIHAS